MKEKKPILAVALDYPDLDQALKMVNELGDRVEYYKLGMELFYACGPSGLARLQEGGKKIFLDLKLHDIPNTVAAAVRSVVRQGIWMINVHAAGGSIMMKAAAEAAADEAAAIGVQRPYVTSVTILTSLSPTMLRDELGVTRSIQDQVLFWSELSLAAGLDGVVCSPQEVVAVREALGNRCLLVTPGIRPRSSSPDDQQRIMTPSQAVMAGSDVLVVGRPITEAESPVLATERILMEMEEAAAQLMKLPSS